PGGDLHTCRRLQPGWVAERTAVDQWAAGRGGLPGPQVGRGDARRRGYGSDAEGAPTMSPTRKAPAKAVAPAAPVARKASSGAVAFVGAGPGDPGLITVRATELLAEAQVVVLAEHAREQLLTWCAADVVVVDGAFDSTGALLTSAARTKAVTG